MPCINERRLLSEKECLLSRNIAEIDPLKFKDKRVAVIGSGYSAATSVKNLLEAQVKHVNWITRKNSDVYDVIDNDVLTERKVLCKRSNELMSSSFSQVNHFGGKQVIEINHKKSKFAKSTYLEIILEPLCDENEEEDTIGAYGNDVSEVKHSVDVDDRKKLLEVDYIISNTGLKPDLSIHSELQVHICYASDGIMKLAASLLGASGDCLAQPAAGIETLTSPEPNFYILGSKSYGRNSSFLLRVGIEQVMALTTKIVDGDA